MSAAAEPFQPEVADRDDVVGSGPGPRFVVRARGGRIVWHLLGRNNRPIALAAQTFETVDDALRAVQALRTTAAHGVVDLVSVRGTRWRWTMSGPDGPSATSSVGYGRRLECERAVERFRRTAPTAVVEPLDRIGRRSASGPAVSH